MSSRWRGLAALVQAGVDAGSRAVERVQLDVVARPLVLAEAIPQLAAPAEAVRTIHALMVSSTHTGIRAVNELVGTALGRVLDAIE